MSISRLAGVLLAFAVLFLPARADEAADRLAAAREAIEASGAVATMTAVLPAIVQQVGDLIVHQGDQRRDDDGSALQHDSGQLIAQRFAATGGHDDKGVTSIQHTLDDGLLISLKCVKAEVLLQGFFQ